jgi:dethiobiotin synthetase
MMLVEGAGGLAVPIINDTLLSLSYAVQRGLRIKGYILNDSEIELSAAAQTNAHSLDACCPTNALG